MKLLICILAIILLMPVSASAETAPGTNTPAILLKQAPVKPAVKKPTPKATPKTAPEPIFNPVKVDFVPYPYSPMGTYPNAYPPGQCTFGAASMKGNITWSGNASDWDDRARALGIPVTDIPIIGSVAQSDRGGWGHVAVVVGVSGDQVEVTEMNYDYNGSVRTIWVPASMYRYIWI